MRFLTFPLLLLFLVSPAHAQDKTKAPTLVLRVQAIDDILADIRYLAEQAGRGEEAKQVEKLLKAMAGGDKGLEGLDTKKAMAFYVFVGSEGLDSQAVLMLPVADKKSFLDTLDRLGVKPNKEKGEVYDVQPQGSPFPVYFRFVNGYVYGTIRDKDVIADNRLLKPDVVLPKTEKDMLSLSLDLSSLPKEMRELVLGQIDQRIDDLKVKQGGETKVQQAFRAAALDEVSGLIKSMLTDATAVSARFGVDRKAGEVAMSLGVAGKPGSVLAKSIAAWGEMKSAVAAIVGADSAMATRVTYELPEGMRKTLSPVIDEGLRKMLDDMDDAAKEFAKPLLEAAAPTLKQARLDFAMDFRTGGEQKKNTLVSAVGVKDGKELAKVIKATLKQLPAEASGKVSLDVARVGEVDIHRLNVENDLDEEVKKHFGAHPAYFAIRDDGAFFTFGEGGLAAIKEAASVRPKTSSVASMEMSLKRLVPFMEKEHKAAPKAAADAFKGQGGDRVTVDISGGSEMRLRFSMKAEVLKFFALLDQAERGN